jgi:hypothetical protein
MQYLTLCFYERPAAGFHISIWEGLMRDQKRLIEMEIVFDSEANCHTGEIIYKVKRDNDVEKLICIPFEKMRNYTHFCLPENTIYLKTLIFGKVTQEQLLFLTFCDFDNRFKKL